MSRYVAHFTDPGDARRLADAIVHHGGPPAVEVGNGWVDLTARITEIAGTDCITGTRRRPVAALNAIDHTAADGTIGLDTRQQIVVALDGHLHPVLTDTAAHATSPAPADQR